MKTAIMCIGKLQEKFWRDAASEYTKRLSRFTNLEIIELKESYIPSNPQKQDINNAIEKESADLLKYITKGDYVICMDIKASLMPDSIDFANLIKDFNMKNQKRMVFLIGGSYGLSDAIKYRADLSISLSNMTFPHQLARIVLLEQIYRAYMINEGSTYHK